MTTVSPPRSGRRFALPLVPSIIAAVLILALIGTFVFQGGVFQRADPLQGRTTAPVTRGTLVAEVTAIGAIQPRVTSNLAFPTTGGRVSAVLVEEGQQVTTNQPLIELEMRRLEANLAAAEADVALAQADLQALREGATPEQIAASEAQVAAARGNLTQTAGSVTTEDIRAAQARVTEAQALVSRLEAGAETTAVQQAEARVQQAEASLQQRRDELSRAKTSADALVQQRAAELVQAQAAYAEARSNWEYVQDTGRNPSQPTVSGPGGTQNNSVTNAQREQFYAAFVQAEAALRIAEQNVQQSQVDADEARRAEVNGIQLAEQQLREFQASADDVRSGPDVDQVEAARAQLARAQADLARLQGQERAGALQAQQANVANAEAQLADLLADPTASELARAEAAVARAQALRTQASAELEDATLRAPFAGVIGTITVAPGETLGSDAPISLLDTERYLVRLSVDEVDVARVSVGQSVEVLIDALGAPALTGTVQRITPQAQSGSDVIAYEVIVEVDPADRPVKPGMTATASIITDRADDVLFVPARAVREVDGQTVVDVVATNETGEQQITTQPVETGLQANDQIEIRSGLRENQVIVLP